MADLVSVVVPAYNAGAMVDEAIRSVLNQTYTNLELVIVNDASTDDTAERIRAFGDSRIRLIEHRENAGEGAARDTAIDSSRGEWIAVLDADDAWAKDRLERLLAMEPSITGDYILLDNIMRCYEKDGALHSWKPLWSSRSDFLKRNVQGLKEYLQLPSLLIKPLVPRRAIVDSGVKHSSLRFSADTEFFVRVIKKANLRFKVLPNALYLYRLTPGSMSSLPERSILMREMFLGLMSELEFTKSESIALAARVSVLDRNIDYMPFLDALQKRNYLKAFAEGVSNPASFVEFLRRFPGTLSYRLFLLLKGGRAR